MVIWKYFINACLSCLFYLNNGKLIVLIPTGTSTSKGCSKPPDQSVHSSDGTAAQNGSDNMKQLNVTQIQVNNIQIMSPTVSQPGMHLKWV